HRVTGTSGTLQGEVSMLNRRPLLALLCLTALLAAPVAMLSASTPSVRAQTGARYENPQLGVAFDLPDGWQVDATGTGLVAAAPADLAIVQDGGIPEGLVVRMLFGT